MKLILVVIVLILLAIITCNLAMVAVSPRAEGIANHAIDRYLDYQQRPAVVLERQLNTVQENSLSNAEGFPIALILMLIGLGILVFANYYETIIKARTEYLKAKKKAEPKIASPKPIQVIDPWAHLRQPVRPPSLPTPPPQANDDDGERW